MTCRLSRPLRQVGEEGDVSGGVFDQGTPAEDGPGTWEALASPRHIPASRRAGGPRRSGLPGSSSLRWRRVDRWRAGQGQWQARRRQGNGA